MMDETQIVLNDAEYQRLRWATDKVPLEELGTLYSAVADRAEEIGALSVADYYRQVAASWISWERERSRS